MRLDAAVVGIFDHLHRQIQRGEVAEEAGHAHDFKSRVRQRLALFGGEQAGEIAGIGLDHVGHFQHQLAPVLDRHRRPSRESRLRRGDGLVELRLGGARALRQHLFGGRIEHGHGLVAVDHLAVDEKSVIAHLDRLSLGCGPWTGLVIFQYISRMAKLS